MSAIACLKKARNCTADAGAYQGKAWCAIGEALVLWEEESFGTEQQWERMLGVQRSVRDLENLINRNLGFLDSDFVASVSGKLRE